MTPAQKEKYMAKKKGELRERLRKQRAEQNRRIEDHELTDIQPLPAPKLVLTPDDLANELFGDIAMVTQFINCFRGLLMGEEQLPIMTDKLMKALCNGANGLPYISQVLYILLQTLLQDGIAEDYKELTVPLSALTITQYSASELVRLCLRKVDTEQKEEENDNDSTNSDTSDPQEEIEVVINMFFLGVDKSLYGKKNIENLMYFSPS